MPMFWNRSRWIVPEVIQTSSMDCGPACLKSLMGGYHVAADYDQLRDSCHTDVDGSSIDRLEDSLNDAGFEAEQLIAPVEHLLSSEAKLLPAIVATRLPGGLAHFIVIWKRIGPWCQIMDPAAGRRWVLRQTLSKQLYQLRLLVSGVEWRKVARSDRFVSPLSARLRRLGVTRRQTLDLVSEAKQDGGWKSLAALDAAVRMTDSIWPGRLAFSRARSRLVSALFAASAQGSTLEDVIPRRYWTAVRAEHNAGGENAVRVRGAVFLRVRRRRYAKPRPGPPSATGFESRKPPPNPTFELLKVVVKNGLLTPWIALTSAFAAGIVAVAEALVLRAVFDVVRLLVLPHQQMAAIGALTAFAFVSLSLAWLVSTCSLRVGRRLETELNGAAAQKVPRIPNRYFASRPSSDIAERLHAAHQLRQFPTMASTGVLLICELAVTVIGVIWLSPSNAALAVAGGVTAVGLPLLFQPVLAERNLRLRTHSGALARFYMDGLKGLTAARFQGAERALATQHSDLLNEWAGTGLSFHRAALLLEGLQSAIGVGIAVVIVYLHIMARGVDTNGLLLAYWSLRLPILGHQLGLIARQYANSRNVALRLLEFTKSEEEIRGQPDTTPVAPAAVSLRFENLGVRIGSRWLLRGTDLSVDSGEHIAVVGPSGAGKTSLVGVALGLLEVTEGSIFVDGLPFDHERMSALRRRTAWVAAETRLWTDSLLANVAYGCDPGRPLAIHDVSAFIDLDDLLLDIPGGMNASVGEDGTLLSGGQAQRLRIGRAAAHREAGLVILDEPFGGLPKKQRSEMMQRARKYWRNSTLILITHDIAQSLDFDRVAVVERGRITEDGDPKALKIQQSRYSALLSRYEAVESGLLNKRYRARIVTVGGGRVIEDRPL